MVADFLLMKGGVVEVDGGNDGRETGVFGCTGLLERDVWVEGGNVDDSI